MDFLELAAERYSVRSYSDKPVEQDKIDRILKAAQLAPTAVNYQPQMIYVLKSEASMAKINRLCRCIYGAPLVFLICSDERKTWKRQTERGYSTGEMDCSIMILCGSIGGVLTPALVGFVAEHSGIHAGMGLIVALTGLLLAAILLSVVSTRPQES